MNSLKKLLLRSKRKKRKKDPKHIKYPLWYLFFYTVKTESNVDLSKPVSFHEATLLPTVDRDGPSIRIAIDEHRKEA